METLPLSLIVITYNEASNIARCLDSVPFAAEKIIIDSGSTDDTVAIAQAHGARVIQQPWLGFGPQRNFGNTHSSHDWVLVLDADEFLSRELIRQLEAGLPALMASQSSAAILRRRTWLMGAPMRWYRPMVGERMARLYHRGRARWTDARVHESLRFEGDAVEFAAPFNHADNPSLLHKQLKVLRYTELKGQDWLDRDRPVRMWLSPLVYLSTFIKDYLLRLAFMDGWRGFIIAQTAASYAVYKRMRYYEMSNNPASVEAARRKLVTHRLEH